MERVIRVVYEDGVLKPLQHLKLGERAICLVSLYPEEKWLKDFQVLLKRIQRRSQKKSPAQIEADITAARAEVKAKRRETNRPA